MKFTNKLNLPLSLAVFLASDDYDYNDDPKTISATTLMKSTRQVVLGTRLEPVDVSMDVSEVTNAAYGRAVHSAIENAWKSNYNLALAQLGIPEKIIERVRVNPEQVTDDCIPVYMEQRESKEIMGWKVTGKYDFIFDGQLEDFKTTSTYKYTNGSSDKDYILQGSIYRWLNPEKITKDTIRINWLFTDWSKLRALQDKKYPQNRIESREFKLMSIAETEIWIKGRLREIDKYLEADEKDIPYCTDEELWRQPTVFKYYKGGVVTTRSTKNFTNFADAQKRKIADGNVGIIKEVKGKVKACLYCPVFHICSQKDYLIQKGDLEI